MTITIMWTYCRIPGREEDRERRWQINVLVTQRDEHTASGTTQLSIQYGVEDRIVVLHVLYQ